MPQVPNPHNETYEVTSITEDTNYPVHLDVVVAAINTDGDVAIGSMFLRKYTSGTSKVGHEDPPDAVACVKLVDNGTTQDYTNAKNEIRPGSVITYTSNLDTFYNIEKISNFIWGH